MKKIIPATTEYYCNICSDKINILRQHVVGDITVYYVKNTGQICPYKDFALCEKCTNLLFRFDKKNICK